MVTALASKVAAEAELLKLLAKRNAVATPVVPAPPPAPVTVASFFADWMAQHAARACSPKTLERYGELGQYFIREVGKIPLNDIVTAQIQNAVHALHDHGGLRTVAFLNGRALAPKTVRRIFTLPHTCFSEAERLGVLTIPHPMANKRIRLPKLIKRHPPVLDKDRLRNLFNSAKGTRIYPLIVTGAATVCRRGELLLFVGGTLTSRQDSSRSSDPSNKQRPAAFE